MAGNWTKGPWRYDTGPSFSGMYHSVLADGETLVCECWEQPDDIAQADAHLIAAAPDLYAALEEMVALDEMTSDAMDWAATPEVIAARAALAKARGEA